MPVDDPAAPGALLPHLASLLTEVPLAGPVAVGLSRPGHEDVELAFRHLDCADVVCALGGYVAPASWVAFGVVAPGTAHLLDRPAEDAVRVVACALVGRDGTVVSEVRDERGTPRAAGASQGRVVDACRRVLGLPTDPPPFGTAVWHALSWVDRVLGAVLDADLGEVPSWDALDALDVAPPAHPDDPRAWRALRRACARGELAVVGVDAGLAAWMDDGMFAREAVGAHGPLATLLGDLRGLLPPPTFDRVVGRVCDHLGA